MKKYIHSVLLVLLLIALMEPGSTVQVTAAPAIKALEAPQSKIDAALRARLNALQANDQITVIVTLRQQADLSHLSGANRAARQQGVLRALQSTASTTQGRLKSLIETRLAGGSVKSYTPFWVFNGFSVTATRAAIDEIAQQPDVFSITADDVQIVPALGTAEPNLSVVNAPAVWNLGNSGEGIVVANMDSGVDVNHPDLLTRWRGGANSWFDPYGQHAVPTDLSGHGTQTMGIMVGGDAGGTTIGVAPGAQWIAVKIFNDAGGSSATAIHQGFQWLLDPDGNPGTADAPHVVNNSWTYANPGCYLDFEPDLQSLRAAGILPVFAAGNGGPSGSTSFSPANNPSALAVGAINNSSQLYAYSSRGPTTCGGSTGPFPELVAPGVLIKTSDLYGTYTSSYSGTSYAAPHVAGGLALLLAAYPNLSAADQQQALISSSVDLGLAGPDDVYGFGRLNLLGANDWLASRPTLTPVPTSTATSVTTFTFTPLPTSTATSVPTFTSTPPPAPTYTPTPASAGTMHIGDLDRSASLSGSKWNATVTIRVHSSNEQPVANATVTGKWSNGASGTVTCVTNSSGSCTITKSGLSPRTFSITFTVTNVARSSLTYISGSNHDPDGDSTGTVILISKP